MEWSRVESSFVVEWSQVESWSRVESNQVESSRVESRGVKCSRQSREFRLSGV